MDNIENQCREICEKLNNNLALFEEMLEITQQLELKSFENDVELCNNMLEQRQDLINKIDKMNQEISLIQSKIIQNIGFEDFNLESIQSFIPRDSYENLTALYALTQKVILQIQDLDRKCSYKAELAKEETKLSLQRTLRNIRPQQSYRQVHVQEARFIDRAR